MSNDEATTKLDGGASVSTAEFGGDFTMPTLNLTNDEPWAVVSQTGALTRFDGQTCRRLAEEFDLDARLDQNKAIARLCVALLDEAAREVDHILREGGGTYGDAIRRLTLTTPNV
jgi:hypothetical protein